MIHEIRSEDLGTVVFATHNASCGMDARFIVPEHCLPEEPLPWSDMVCEGRRYVGQATSPPEMLMDGRVAYSLNMQPESE